MKEQRVFSYDLIRAAAALGIVVFHFSSYTSCAWKPLLTYRNGDFGNVLLNIFFILSGALLYRRYPQLGGGAETGAFYYKRWKNVFPAFYLAYLYYFMNQVLAGGQLFYKGSPHLLLQTVLGVDGYLQYRFPGNYYILGEWFTGAIVLLYLLYPLFLRLFRKAERATAAGLLVLYVLMLFGYEADWFLIPDTRNFVSCLLSFWMGMELEKHLWLLEDKRIVAASWAGILLLGLVFVPLPSNITGHGMALFAYVVLYDLGKRLFRHFSAGAVVIREVSRISYGIFLLQHVTILQVMGFKNPETPWKMLAVLAFTCGLTLIRAEVLCLAANGMLASRLYQRAEGQARRAIAAFRRKQ